MLKTKSYKNVVFRAPEWKLDLRPDYLDVKRKAKQAKYSMGWKKKKGRVKSFVWIAA